MRAWNKLSATFVRAVLQDHPRKGRFSDGGGLYLQACNGGVSWIFQYQRSGRERSMGLGSARSVSLARARKLAQQCRKLLEQNCDPIEHHKAASSRPFEDARRKFLTFIEQGNKPACYLYRHYHPSGDLLYVGVSIVLTDRQLAHFRDAEWRDAIHQIIVEPFATREEALAAERQAIETEFPKFNRIHNGRLSPLREIRRALVRVAGHEVDGAMTERAALDPKS